tara:strand:- start:1315 stop:2307 length:993 start_codon:yes stop_codon:yes gene_type:complete
MKKNIIKKIFILLARKLGFELIDQAKFISPTLNTEINKNLTNNNNSIILPLGKVELKRKIKDLLIIFRTNMNVHIWDQNKKRIFEKPKVEYVKRSLNSLIKAIRKLNEIFPQLNIEMLIVDSGSKKDYLDQISKIIENSNININIINHNINDHESIIKKQKNSETFSNLSSLLKCFEIAKSEGKDLIYFVEDDYIHFKSSLEEMIETYERISSQLNNELFICPTDYPNLYMNNEKTTLLIGSKRHWRTINKTLCTFMTSKSFINKYWDNFYQTCLDRNDPFEKFLNNLYEKEICISPIKSLSIHLTNINSSYGLSPFIDYKSLWEENEKN